MLTIYEYILLPYMIKTLYMPKNAQILSIEECGYDFILKVEADFTNENKKYQFIVITAGQRLEFGFNKYIASVKSKKNKATFHVFLKEN